MLYISLVVTDLLLHQVIENFAFQFGSYKRKMRCFIAVVLASAIPIVTAAAWPRAAKDKQYTIKATNIKAQVSCLAKN